MGNSVNSAIHFRAYFTTMVVPLTIFSTRGYSFWSSKVSDGDMIKRNRWSESYLKNDVWIKGFGWDTVCNHLISDWDFYD